MKLIVALNNHHVIGRMNALPWKLQTDMRFFREKTLNKMVIMGSKTFKSMGFKPLKNRINVILSNKNILNLESYHYDDETIIFKTGGSSHEVIDTLISYFKLNVTDNKDKLNNIVIIGGGVIYGLFLPLVTECYITRVDNDTLCDGDVLFTHMNYITTHFTLKEIINKEDYLKPNDVNDHHFTIEHWVRND